MTRLTPAQAPNASRQTDTRGRIRPAFCDRHNEQLALEWTYDSNAIEGNTLTLRETQLMLETGLTIGGKSLREQAEVINHQQAIAYVTSLASRSEVPIRGLEVRQVHALVLKGIDDGEADKWRTVPAHFAGARFTPPEPFVNGDVFSLAWSYGGMGECALLLGAYADARRRFEHGMRTFESSGGREGVLILTHHLARLDMLENRLGAATEGFVRCIALCDASDYPQMRSRCIAGLGCVAVRAGQPELGVTLLAAAKQLYDALPPFLLPLDLAEYEACAAESRRLLGDAKFMLASRPSAVVSVSARRSSL
jgi:hypothetical protein